MKSRRFLPLALLFAVPAQVLLWTIGSIATPHPYVFAALLMCSLLGGAGCVLIGLIRIAEVRAWSLCVIFGVAVWGSIGFFVYAVLSNADGELAVMDVAPPIVGPVNRLRILDLNVLHGFPDFEDQQKRFLRTVEEFQGINADIIVLQEAWTTTQHGCMAERLAKKLGMNYLYARANGSRSLIGFEEGSAILSRFPLSNGRRVLLAPHEPFWENRIALLADIDLGGEIVTIAGVHLSTSIPDSQAKHLVAALPKKNLLFVAGDFNSELGSGAITEMDRAGFKRLDPNESLVYFPSTLVAPMPKERIDHVFLTAESERSWTAERSVYILTSENMGPCELRSAISDHDAIVVELRRR